MSASPFNPLDKTVLARTVAKALLEAPLVPLPPPEPFAGAGLYAIYYVGDFAAYRKIATLNRNERYAAPIYVGRAVPKGARKGKHKATGLGRELFDRLKEHAESIERATNLRLQDFSCRYLVVEDLWIPLGERILIKTFTPLWNQVVDGFGNHDPGVRRKDQWRSDWDVLHPGRPWAEKLGKSKRTPRDIEKRVEESLKGWMAERL